MALATILPSLRGRGRLKNKNKNMNQELSQIYNVVNEINLTEEELATVSLAIEHAYLLGKNAQPSK